METRKIWSRRLLPIGILCVLVLILCLAGLLLSHRRSADLAKLDAQIQDLQQSLDATRNAQSDLEDIARQTVSGMDAQRVALDQSRITDVMKRILTWSNPEGYAQVRAYLTETYPEDQNPKLYRFFPEAPSALETTNLSFVSLDDLRVLSIDGQSYRYFTQVYVSANDAAGNSATSHFAFFCTVAEDGSLSQMEMYTLSE